MDGDNPNPTTRDVSDLPTRRRNGKTTARHDPFDDVVLRRPQYLSTPFCDMPWSDESASSDDDFTAEPIDELEIYDLISTISDPEHPLILGQLNVVNLEDIRLSPSPAASSDPNALVRVVVKLTPTVNHCSLATVIGLGVRVRLEKTLPPNYRVDVLIKEGTHAQDKDVNKQMADKERVAAALENDTLKGVIDKMLETCL